MKRILFVLPSLNVGGLERVQVTLANALAEIGYDVTVMTIQPGEELRSELKEAVHFVYKPPKMHLGNYIRPIRHRFYDDGMWETRASAKQLHDYYVGKEHFDVEIAFFRGLPIKIISGCPKAKRDSDFDAKSLCTQDVRTTISRKSVRTLAWVHNDFEKAVGYKNNFKSMQEVFEAYSSFDRVVCVSDQAQEGFKKVIGDTGNLTTIYNMLPVNEILRKAEEIPEVKVHKDGFHLVLVGRLLDSAKGQKRLISAVARLHDEGHDVSLVLVGGGGDEAMLRTHIEKLHAKEYITMTGSQLNPYPYIKEAELLVCASYFEGYNLTVAEALILGTPVLSTDCTGPNEILNRGEYGMIVENSEIGLYEGIKELIENPEKLRYFKEMAGKRRDFFDENGIVKQITALFEEKK